MNNETSFNQNHSEVVGTKETAISNTPIDNRKTPIRTHRTLTMTGAPSKPDTATLATEEKKDSFPCASQSVVVFVDPISQASTKLPVVAPVVMNAARTFATK